MQLSGTVGEGMNPIWVSHASYGSPCFMFQWQIARLKNGSGIAQTICNMLLGKMLNVPRKCKTLSTVMATQWHQWLNRCSPWNCTGWGIMQKPKEPSYWLFKAVWKGGGEEWERKGAGKGWRSGGVSWIIWRCGWEESVSWGFFWLKLEGKKKKRGREFHSPAAGQYVLRCCCCSPASCTRLTLAKAPCCPSTWWQIKKITAAFVYKKRFFAFFLARFEVNCHLKEHHIPYWSSEDIDRHILRRATLP